MPIFLGLMFVFFFSMKKQFHDCNFFSTFFRSMIVSIFILQPNIFTNLFSIMDCRSFDPQPGKSYVRTFLTEECFTNNYWAWIIGFVIPTFLLYAFLEPLITLIYLYKNKENLKKTKFLVDMSFLIQGFHKNSFYW